MNTSELKGYLTGLIMGDGYIDSGVTKRAFRIKSINKDFINKIYKDISSCNTFKSYVRHLNKRIDKNNVVHKEHWEFVISAHPYFVKKYHHFYDDYKKRIISNEALQWITPSGIANWYMSDGYVCLVGKERGDISGRRVEFCTDRYSYETVNKINKMLLNNFNIKNSIISRGKTYRIRVLTESYSSFFNLIKPYIVNSMKYKMYLGYKKQPKWMDDDMWNEQIILASATT